MTNTKHTPGPCPFCKSTATKVNAFGLRSVEWYRVECISCGATGSPKDILAHAVHSWNVLSGGINSDLLAACEDIIEDVEEYAIHIMRDGDFRKSGSEMMQRVKAARAAIAKAKGET